MSQDDGRALRRRHMHERQAVVFGVLLAGLAVAGLGSAAMYTGALSLPFLDRPFTSDPTDDTAAANVYCPPEGALPVSPEQITVDVYNSTEIPGLGSRTKEALEGFGFVVRTVDNTDAEAPGVGRIIYGVQGSAAAYTLISYAQGATLVLDGRQDAVVDLVLGADFALAASQEQVALDPAVPLVGPEGCTPLSEASPASADGGTATEPAQPAEG